MKKSIFTAATFSLIFIGQMHAQSSFIIDNFNQGSFNLTANSGTPSVPQLDSGLSASNTIGGSRISRAHFVSGGGLGDSLNVNNTALAGSFEVSCTTTASGHFHLYYGYSNYDTTTEDPVAVSHTFTDMNTNVQASLGSNIGVALDFTSLDHPATLVFKIVTNHTGGTQTVSVVTKAVAADLNPFTFSLTSAELTAGIISGSGLDFTDVDQIILQSNDLAGGTDFRADNFRFVTAVPEPATVALMGICVAGATAGYTIRRRRQAKLMEASVAS